MPGGWLALAGLGATERFANRGDALRDDPQRLLTALIAPDTGKAWRIRGVRLVATDLGFSAGIGSEVRGAAEALLMTIAGRRGVVGQLSGPGQRKLARRIDGR